MISGRFHKLNVWTIFIEIDLNNSTLNRYVVYWNCYLKIKKKSSYDELKKKYSNKIEYTSGGSGQNTLRTISVSVATQRLFKRLILFKDALFVAFVLVF